MKIKTRRLRRGDIVYDKQGESFKVLARPEKWRADGRFGFVQKPVLEARYWEPKGWAVLVKPARGSARAISLQGYCEATRASYDEQPVPRGVTGTKLWTT
jgi:hypothetical protein